MSKIAQQDAARMQPGRLFVAVDTPDRDRASALVRTLGDNVGGIKLGLEFFAAEGPDGVRAVMAGGQPLFLDLKLHDIPNTVAGAVRSALSLKPAFMTVHTSGGPAMMRAAADAAAGSNCRLLGVTVLTSLDDADLSRVGQQGPALAQVRRLALLARESGLNGIVCAPHEVAAVRAETGPGFAIVVPGIRPAWAEAGDQKRAMSPAQAMAAGADHLVVGRPITGAADPAEAARRILAEIGS